MMKIAMDGQLLLESSKTGIAWNAHNLILELAKYPENKRVLQIFSCRCTKEQLCRLEEYQRLGCSIEYCRWFKSSWYKFAQAILPLPWHWFFHTEAVEPRKNLERLIGAYGQLCREKTGIPQLVLAGKKGWLCGDIYEKARRLNLGDNILFAGYVN